MGGKISLQPRSIRHMVPALVSPWERQSRWKAEMKWRSKVNSMIKFLIKDKTLITSKLLKNTLNVSWTFHVHVSINFTCHGDICNSRRWSWGNAGGVFTLMALLQVTWLAPGRQSWQPVGHPLAHRTSLAADWWAHVMCMSGSPFFKLCPAQFSRFGHCFSRVFKALADVDGCRVCGQLFSQLLVILWFHALAQWIKFLNIFVQAA